MLHTRLIGLYRVGGGVEYCIRTNFKDFLEYGDLSQCENNRSIYKNSLGIEFYHDFDKTVPLAVQFSLVKHKYDRRIKRFYKHIKEPTLFIRYIQNAEEFLYQIKEYERILSYLKSFNNHNYIIYIANDDVFNSIDNCPFTIFFVKKDKNDLVARRFTDKNKELKEYLIRNTNVVNSKARNNILIRVIQHLAHKYYSSKGEYHHGKVY